MLTLRHFVIMIVLILVLIFIQYRLWWEQDGLSDFFHLKQAYARQQMENISLKKRNEALLSQINHLRSNQEAIETRARDELGMIKKGETFYQIVK